MKRKPEPVSTARLYDGDVCLVQWDDGRIEAHHPRALPFTLEPGALSRYVLRLIRAQLIAPERKT